MRTLSILVSLIVGLAKRILSAFVTLLIAVALVPVRVAAVESRWITGQTADPADPTEALLDSSWHFKPRRPVARSGPAPDPADPHEGGLRNS